MHRSGRIVDEVDRLGYGDNTLIVYIWGDNGSSAEGQNGTISELIAQNGIPTTIAQHIAALEELGGLDVLGSPKTDNSITPAGPGQGARLTRAPSSRLALWRHPQPDGGALASEDQAGRNATRRNSTMSTILSRRSTKIVGITPPKVVNGIPQDPIDGVSMAYSFQTRRQRAETHAVFRDHGQPRHLSEWLDGVCFRAAPAVGAGPAAGHAGVDPGQGHLGAIQCRGGLVPSEGPRCPDAGKARPTERNIFDRSNQKQSASHRWRAVGPVPCIRNFVLFHHTSNGRSPGTWCGCRKSCAPALGNKEQSVSIDAEIPPNANGVLYALGAFSGGLAAYIKDGKLCYEYNLFEIQRTKACSPQNIATGKVKVEVETVYAEAKPAGPLNVTLKVNGTVVVRTRVPVSAPLFFTANDCLDIGTDLGSPVALDYFDKAPFAFNGKIAEVKVKYLK